VAGMTLPDVRRLLQVVLAVAAPRYPVPHAIVVSDWRQQRNRIARVPRQEATTAATARVAGHRIAHCAVLLVTV
jgi:hypothetical protein